MTNVRIVVLTECERERYNVYTKKERERKKEARSEEEAKWRESSCVLQRVDAARFTGVIMDHGAFGREQAYRTRNSVY